MIQIMGTGRYRGLVLFLVFVYTACSSGLPGKTAEQLTAYPEHPPPGGMVAPPEVAAQWLERRAPSTLLPSVNILVFGDYSDSRTALVSKLASFGGVVTEMVTLPADLSSYRVIWHVGAFQPLTTSERARLASFLAAGGGLHLTGERPCCESLNSSLTAFVQSVVVGGSTITVGGQGDIHSTTNEFGYPYAVNPLAPSNAASYPHSIDSLFLAASGGITGLPGDNVLARGYQGVPVGGIWDSSHLVGGQGRLTLIMDVNWFHPVYQGPQNVLAYENIQNYLQSEPQSNHAPTAVCQDVTRAVDATCQAVVQPADVGGGSFDPDGNPISLALNPAGPFPLGTTNVTLTVTDPASLSSQCHAMINAVDQTAPAISCPPTATAECTGSNSAVVTVGNAASSDNCGGSTISGPAGTASYPVGSTVLAFSATDVAGNTATCTSAVEVVDTVPPQLSTTPPAPLWPLDHQYRTITLDDCAPIVQDTCGGTLSPNTYQAAITCVTSDEPDDTVGNHDGNTINDIVIVNDTTVQLRAERHSSFDGRVYKIHFTVRDASGNTSNGVCPVVVPYYECPDAVDWAAIDSGGAHTACN